MVKTNKAQLLHHLESKVESCSSPEIDLSVYVIDGNAVLQACVHLPETFEDLALQIFVSLPKSKVIHFVTDSYQQHSIKQFEHDRRGQTAAYCIKGPRTKIPSDFKAFMLNASNKTQLIRFLLSQWQSDKYATRFLGRQIYFVCEEKCVCLTSLDGVTTSTVPTDSLNSNQEEADTRIVLHCLHVTEPSTSETVVKVRSPDTDVLIILLYYAERIKVQLYFDTGVGSKRRMIDIQAIAKVIGSDVCQALPAFHAFTGCDFNSAFVRRGKLSPYKLLNQHSEFKSLFGRMGNLVHFQESNTADMERFVCHMYGRPACSDVNKVRFDLFCSRYDVKSECTSLTVPDGIDLSLLPPCQSSLLMHARRANYIAFIWQNAHVQYPNIPGPNGFGWKLHTDGSIAVEWNDGDIMPQQLIDILPSSDCDTATNTENFQGLEVEEDYKIDNILDVVFDEDED